MNIINANFNGQNLIIVNHNNEPYVPMKAIVEGMGLDWKSQYEKIKANIKRFCMVEITIQLPGNDQKRSVICMPLRKIMGWLMTIHPNKIQNELTRNKVIQYQDECDDVLWKYWTEGKVENPKARPEKSRKMIEGGLTLEQQDAVKAHHKTLMQHMNLQDAGSRAKLSIALWSSVKSKFGVTYKDVPQENFDQVISLMTRVTLEGDWLPAEKPVQLSLPLEDGRYLTVINEGKQVVTKNIDTYAVMDPSVTTALERDVEAMIKLQSELMRRIKCHVIGTMTRPNLDIPLII